MTDTVTDAMTDTVTDTVTDTMTDGSVRFTPDMLAERLRQPLPTPC
jgi:hypothetical protein